jgi:hypothetical protein
VARVRRRWTGTGVLTVVVSEVMGCLLGEAGRRIFGVSAGSSSLARDWIWTRR